EASAADLVLLDDGGPHPELGGPHGRHVAPGTGTDDDAVISGFGHDGESMSPPVGAAVRPRSAPPGWWVGTDTRGSVASRRLRFSTAVPSAKACVQRSSPSAMATRR